MRCRYCSNASYTLRLAKRGRRLGHAGRPASDRPVSSLSGGTRYPQPLYQPLVAHYCSVQRRNHAGPPSPGPPLRGGYHLVELTPASDLLVSPSSGRLRYARGIAPQYALAFFVWLVIVSLTHCRLRCSRTPTIVVILPVDAFRVLLSYSGRQRNQEAPDLSVSAPAGGLRYPHPSPLLAESDTRQWSPGAMDFGKGYSSDTCGDGPRGKANPVAQVASGKGSLCRFLTSTRPHSVDITLSSSRGRFRVHVTEEEMRRMAALDPSAAELKEHLRISVAALPTTSEYAAIHTGGMCFMFLHELLYRRTSLQDQSPHPLSPVSAIAGSGNNAALCAQLVVHARRLLGHAARGGVGFHTRLLDISMRLPH